MAESVSKGIVYYKHEAGAVLMERIVPVGDPSHTYSVQRFSRIRGEWAEQYQTNLPDQHDAERHKGWSDQPVGPYLEAFRFQKEMLETADRIKAAASAALNLLRWEAGQHRLTSLESVVERERESS